MPERWEYRVVDVAGRMDLHWHQIQTLGNEGWEGFAATNGRLWFKRLVAAGASERPTT